MHQVFITLKILKTAKITNSSNAILTIKKKLLSIFKKLKPKGIFNLAAETHVDRSIERPKMFIKNNIDGTFSLLEAIRKFSRYVKNCRLVHISTDEVFGDILKGRSSENDTYKPSSPYAASKASSDHLDSSYVRTFNLNAIINNCNINCYVGTRNRLP